VNKIVCSEYVGRYRVKVEGNRRQTGLEFFSSVNYTNETKTAAHAMHLSLAAWSMPYPARSQLWLMLRPRFAQDANSDIVMFTYVSQLNIHTVALCNRGADNGA